MFRLMFAGFLLLSGFLAQYSQAFYSEDNKEPEGSGTGIKSKVAIRGVKDVEAAYRMIHFGRENKCPEALVAGAQMLAKIPFRKMEAIDGKPLPGESTDSTEEAKALLEEASKIAGDPSQIQGIVQAAKRNIGERTRGAEKGPKTRENSLSSKDRQDVYTIRFRANEDAVIIVNNLTNRGNIQLVVEDDNGVIATDFDKDDDASVYIPASRFPKAKILYIKIKNGRPDGILKYRLTTN